eukprot:304027-Chlamydomonas_euryale.AAC.3
MAGGRHEGALAPPPDSRGLTQLQTEVSLRRGRRPDTQWMLRDKAAVAYSPPWLAAQLCVPAAASRRFRHDFTAVQQRQRFQHTTATTALCACIRVLQTSLFASKLTSQRRFMPGNQSAVLTCTAAASVQSCECSMSAEYPLVTPTTRLSASYAF